jgi:citrate lyase subunit beta/citryl-CoA lyase
VESREDVLEALAELDAAGGSHLPIMLMIESPIGVLRAEEIAAASERIATIVMATGDLLNQLHGRRTPDRVAVVHSLSQVLLAGRAYDRAVVDGISTDLKDMQSFELACRLGRDLGFDGKSLVHPFQLPYCNDAFTPKPYDLTAALEVIEALENANREGRGTVVVNGRLIEGHHVKAARRLLALADMVKKLEAGQ